MGESIRGVFLPTIHRKKTIPRLETSHPHAGSQKTLRQLRPKCDVLTCEVWSKMLIQKNSTQPATCLQKPSMITGMDGWSLKQCHRSHMVPGGWWRSWDFKFQECWGKSRTNQRWVLHPKELKQPRMEPFFFGPLLKDLSSKCLVRWSLRLTKLTGCAPKNFRAEPHDVPWKWSKFDGSW